MLWLDLKTYKTLPKAAKYYGQERRIGLLHFQSNPENSSQISFVFVKSAFSVKIEKWWQDHVTGLRRLRIPWYQHEPRQQRALSTTLQNGFLIISFFLCFSSWQKTEANNYDLQHLRAKLKSVNNGKWLIIHNQPGSRKSHLKYSYHLASNFSAYIFDNFKPPKNLLNLCCRELKGNWDGNFKDMNG